jgi:hypothetical protein
LSELRALERRLTASAADADHVHTTIEFIETNVPQEKWQQRSALLKILDRKKWPPRDDLIWRNAVQCWNYATELTLAPEGGSVARLEHATMPSTEADRVVDLIAPFEPAKREFIGVPSGLAHITQALDWDVDSLTWTDILRARRSTRATTDLLNNARRLGDRAFVEHALKEHAEQVARSVAVPSAPAGTSLLYLAAGGAAILFGDPDTASALGTAVAYGTDTVRGYAVAKGLEGLRRSTLRHIQKHTIVSTLRETLPPKDC